MRCVPGRQDSNWAITKLADQLCATLVNLPCLVAWRIPEPSEPVVVHRQLQSRLDWLQYRRLSGPAIPTPKAAPSRRIPVRASSPWRTTSQNLGWLGRSIDGGWLQLSGLVASDVQRGSRLKLLLADPLCISISEALGPQM